MHSLLKQQIASAVEHPMPQLIGEPPGRIAPLDELVNTSEFEAMAMRKLDSPTGAQVASGSRTAEGLASPGS